MVPALRLHLSLHNGLILFRELPIYVDLPEASAVGRKIHIFIIDYLLIDPEPGKNAKESCCFLKEEGEVESRGEDRK